MDAVKNVLKMLKMGTRVSSPAFVCLPSVYVDRRTESRAISQAQLGLGNMPGIKKPAMFIVVAFSLSSCA